MITQKSQIITSRLEKLRETYGTPIINLGYGFEPISLDGGVEFIKKLVDSGSLFEFENYLYHNPDGKIVSNIHSRPYIFDLSAKGEVSFKRYKNLLSKPHGIITCTLWNRPHGYFEELVEQFPALVPTVENFLKHFNIDFSKCYQICLGYFDKYLPFHIDIDYKFAVRLNVNQSKYLYNLKRIPDSNQQNIVNRFLYPEKNESYDNLLALVKDYPIENTFSEVETGQSFIIDSYNYLHDFIPNGESWIVSIFLDEF